MVSFFCIFCVWCFGVTCVWFTCPSSCISVCVLPFVFVSSLQDFTLCLRSRVFLCFLCFPGLCVLDILIFVFPCLFAFVAGFLFACQMNYKLPFCLIKQSTKPALPEVSAFGSKPLQCFRNAAQRCFTARRLQAPNASLKRHRIDTQALDNRDRNRTERQQ